jgi:5-methylcytosine-specific restriction endonuclease McrA
LGRDNVAYMREYQVVKYAKLRCEMIQLLGGKCVQCGSVEDLQMDHKDPSTKKYSLNQLVFRTHETFLAEVAKCQLLCGDCHIEKSKVEHNKRMMEPKERICLCGRVFPFFAAYVGHRRWCRVSGA